MLEITSKENANIKFYNKLMLSKRARNEYNMFTFEGAKMICDAACENLELNCVYVTEEAANKYSEALNLVKNKGLTDRDIFLITDEISQRMTATTTPQGFYAICKKLDKTNYADTIKSDGRYVVLNNLQDPGNIGAIIRTADAMGIDGIFTTDDCCDIYNQKLIRATMGSMFRVNIWDELSIYKIMEIFAEKGVKTFAAVIDNDAKDVLNVDFSNGGAVLIGNEGSGLPRQISNVCDQKITIKMKGNINSLNAAMATSIIMWEMLK